MKKICFLLIVIFVGCSDPDENASSNLRKGDEFYARGEFEIAEYYYDQIPEESVLYKTVLRRRQEMMKKQPAGTESASATGGQKKQEGVFITKHSHILQLGRMPIHTITIKNNTSKRLNILELELVYLDDSGKEVARLQSMVNANADPDEEKELGKIAPGMVSQKFSRVKIEIKRSLLF